jgi:hypothetical protein
MAREIIGSETNDPPPHFHTPKALFPQKETSYSRAKQSTVHSTTTTTSIMSVVGVDLGYQNTCIAAAGRGGVDVLMNGSAKRLNP